MKNKKFREITVSGSEYEMGLQIGEECKDEIKDLVGITLQRFNLSSKKNISLNQVTNLVKKIIYCSKDFLDDEFNELEGISRSSNVKFEDLMMLNCRNMFGAVSEGCTTVLISSERSSEESSIAGQNWDNDPLMMDFSIVLTRKPNYKPNNTTWAQPGLSAYMGINSEGTAICMNALNGPVSTVGIPWYFIVRKFFGTKGFDEINNILKNISNLDYSTVFFIPASKINFYISKFKEFFFDRKIVIAKEMTKIHEEFMRSDVKSIKSLSESLKGELTVILSEKIKEKNTKKEVSESVKIEIKKMLKKYSHKDVVEFISKKENLPKKIIYNYCLKLKIK